MIISFYFRFPKKKNQKKSHYYQAFSHRKSINTLIRNRHCLIAVNETRKITLPNKTIRPFWHQKLKGFKSAQLFQALSTRIRVFFNPQLFVSGYRFSPHVSYESGIRNFLRIFFLIGDVTISSSVLYCEH